MSITLLPDSLKAALNRAGLNGLASMLQKLAFGDVVRALRAHLFGKVPVANPYDGATLQVIVLPDDAKATSIERAYARTTSGAGTLGELAVEAAYATPIDGQIAVTPSGNIAVVGTSAYTAIDLSYYPAKGDIVEEVLPVVSGTGVLTLPAALGFGVMLLEAEVLAATTGVGKCVIDAPSGSASASLHAHLNVAKTTVIFHVADAVTSARVKYLVAPKADVDALLESSSPIL